MAEAVVVGVGRTSASVVRIYRRQIVGSCREVFGVNMPEGQRKLDRQRHQR